MSRSLFQTIKKIPNKIKRFSSTLKWFFRYIKQAGIWIFIGVTTATVISGLTIPVQLWALGETVNQFTINQGLDGVLSTIILWLVLMVGAQFIGNVMSRWSETMRRYLEEKVILHVQTDLYKKATSIEYGYFEKEAYYNNLQRANSGMGNYFIQIVFQTYNLLELIVKIIGLAFLVGQGHWAIPLILLVAGIPIFFLQGKYNVENYLLSKEQTPDTLLMNYLSNLLTSRQAAKEVRLYGISDYLINRWKKLYEKIRVQILQQSIRHRIYMALIESLHALTFGISLWLLIRSLQAGELTIGLFTTIIYAVISMQSDWEWSIRYFGWIQEDYMRFVRDLLSFFSLPNKANLNSTASPKLLNMNQGIKIELNNLSYSYPDTTGLVLKKINLTIHPGEKIALIGKNGSGKSTLVKLISGLLEPTAGEIRINEKIVASESIWQQTSVVFQDYNQYHMTVKENVGLGDVEKIEDRVYLNQAIAKGGATSLVEKWETNIDTMLGPTFGGQDISGGEWQKVATSRGFMPKAHLYILDEPTASLDAIAEEQVYQRFQEMAGDQTAILISHRIGFASLADRIIVLEDGEIVENGTHEELSVKNGEYAKLLSLQAKWYQ